MFTLHDYKKSDTPLLKGFFSTKEVYKYTNGGGMLYYLFFEYVNLVFCFLSKMNNWSDAG